jgi:glutamate dehydrogenase/leucine dehydrogenase
MALQKLTSTDAFVVVDLPDAPASGVVRRARKILQGSAKDLARSATYSFAAFELKRGGASAGINAEGDAVDGAIESFAEELVPLAEAGELHLEAGKGVDPAQLTPLRSAAGIGPTAGSNDLLGASVVAATAWALGGNLAGRTVAIEGHEQVPAEVVEAVKQAGATVVDVWGVDDKPWLVWGAEVDAILAGSKPGTLTHQGTEFITAQAIVPWGPLPVTTKAFAQLRRGGAVTVIPDFISTAGYLVSGFLDGDPAAVTETLVQRVLQLLDEAAEHPDGVLLGACYRAEAFLESWQETKPFGRPLAG